MHFFHTFLIISLRSSHVSSFILLFILISSHPFSSTSLPSLSFPFIPLSLSTSLIHPFPLPLSSSILTTASLQFSPLFSQTYIPPIHVSSTLPPHILHCCFSFFPQYHSAFISFPSLNLATLFHLLFPNSFFKYLGMPDPFTALYHLLFLEFVILSYLSLLSLSLPSFFNSSSQSSPSHLLLSNSPVSSF